MSEPKSFMFLSPPNHGLKLTSEGEKEKWRTCFFLSFILFVFFFCGKAVSVVSDVSNIRPDILNVRPKNFHVLESIQPRIKTHCRRSKWKVTDFATSWAGGGTKEKNLFLRSWSRLWTVVGQTRQLKRVFDPFCEHALGFWGTLCLCGLAMHARPQMCHHGAKVPMLAAKQA